MFAVLWASPPHPAWAIRIVSLALDWIATNARDQLRDMRCVDSCFSCTITLVYHPLSSLSFEHASAAKRRFAYLVLYT